MDISLSLFVFGNSAAIGSTSHRRISSLVGRPNKSTQDARFIAIGLYLSTQLSTALLKLLPAPARPLGFATGHSWSASVGREWPPRLGEFEAWVFFGAFVAQNPASPGSQ